MPLDLFSKRRALAAKAGTAEVFIYDALPAPLRMQVVHILRRAMSREHRHQRQQLEEFWAQLGRWLAEEHGFYELPNPHREDHSGAAWNYFLAHSDVGRALDALELFFKGLNRYVREQRDAKNYEFLELQDPDDAIADLNKRFREHSIGYEFNADANQLIEVNSQYMHAEAVTPALHLLNADGFAGPQDEFLGPTSTIATATTRRP